MYKVVAVAEAKNGMAREAIAAIKALVDYGKSTYGSNYEVYMQMLGGTAGTIYVIGDYKDLDAYQAAQAKVMADDKYWALVKKAAEFSVAPPTISLLRLV
jgi:quinol monooxygenase YgiN